MKIDLIRSDSPFIAAINAKKSNRLMLIKNGVRESALEAGELKGTSAFDRER